MRKIIFVFAFILLLSGCSNAPEATPQEAAKAFRRIARRVQGFPEPMKLR